MIGAPIGFAIGTSFDEDALSAALSATLADWTLASEGDIAANAVAVTLDDVTVSATGELLIQGSLTATLANWSTASAAEIEIQAAITAALEDWTLASTAGSATGVNVTLEDWTLASHAIVAGYPRRIVTASDGGTHTTNVRASGSFRITGATGGTVRTKAA